MKIFPFKRHLVILYELAYSKFQHWKHILRIRTLHRLRIMTSAKTIHYILKNKCSIARYGDGEFSQMVYDYNIGFQQHNEVLAEKLRNTLCINDKNLLICIPKYLVSVRYCNENARNFWINWGEKNNQQVKITNLLRQLCGKRYQYGDALITRPYIDLKSKKHAEIIFPLLKKLWDNRDILIIEGKETRLGIGNDLFSNAKSISRILAPAKNAFDSYDEILSAAETYCKDHLVLIALGPTATVLAADLSAQGIQALDIGHIDIEYEWYLRNAVVKIQIPGKFTNEVNHNTVTENCTNPEYLQQIVHIVE